MTTLERTTVSDRLDPWLSTLSEWVSIPSVSVDPDHHDDVRRSAHFLADALREAGFPTVDVLDDGPYLPAVHAHWPSGDAGAVRVLVYGHHDVQPASFEDGWSVGPFEPTVRDRVMHGRGVSDDKGNVAIHLLGLAAHLRATGRTAPAVDLTIVVEGEEEAGSPHFDQLLTDLGDRLDPDVVVVSDAGIFDAQTPSVVTGMRGLVEGELHVHGPDVDIHSGSFGGAVANPITELCRMVAAIHDADRHIAVPGFYEGVDEPTDEDRKLLGALPFDEAVWLRDAAVSTAAVGEAGYSTLERLGMRPTAEINGIRGGYAGPGNKTIVPSDAYAKLSFRLVGRQDPDAVMVAVDDFIEGHTPPGVRATMTWHGSGVRPVVVPTDHPATLATRRALGQAFDTDTVLVTREGGSGPEAALAGATGATMVFLGVMTGSDRIHAPDERASIDLLANGAEAVAHLWRELAGVGRAALGR